MLNYFQQTIDIATFNWWLNVNNSDILNIIGGDGDLPEKNLIIRALERNDFTCLLLETRKNLIDASELMGLINILYKKVSPFCHTEYQPNTSDLRNRQSVLALLTLYNICHVVIDENKTQRNKVSFDLKYKLSEAELLLFKKTHSTLKKFFSEIFKEDIQELIQTHGERLNKECTFSNKAMLFAAIFLSIASCLSYVILHLANISMTFLAITSTILLYLYFVRVELYSIALERYLIKTIQKIN